MQRVAHLWEEGGLRGKLCLKTLDGSPQSASLRLDLECRCPAGVGAAGEKWQRCPSCWGVPCNCAGQCWLTWGTHAQWMPPSWFSARSRSESRLTSPNAANTAVLWTRRPSPWRPGAPPALPKSTPSAHPSDKPALTTPCPGGYPNPHPSLLLPEATVASYCLLAFPARVASAGALWQPRL